MVGSKNEAKRNWTRGRTANSCRHDKKFSLKMNKKMLNRKVRRYTGDLPQNMGYKRLGKEAAWDYCL